MKKKEIEKSQNIETENKLVTTKPWFSKSSILKSQEENLKSVSLAESSESFCFHPSSKPLTTPSQYI